jgi:O-succinylhomoserine sulfhydrylase
LLTKIAALEEGEAAWATATGMAAVFTTFAALLKSGDHIVSSRSVFGSTHQLFMNILPKWGITTTYVDSDDYEAYAQAITSETKILYLETPSNPGLDIIDLEKIGKICNEEGTFRSR